MRFFLTLFALFLSLSSHAKLTDGLYANLATNQGEILIQLNFEKAPLTVINFVGLAEGAKHSNRQTGKPFYDGLTFHRVIDNFMIQGGDPLGNGTGGPGYQFEDEITDLKHDRGGILSMANSGPNTNGSQFFITHEATPWLDGKHTVFGHVVKGMDVVNSIKQDDFIRKVKIIRIGEKAKHFKTDEAAFNTHQQQKKQQSLQKLLNFSNQNYPNAKPTDKGYLSQINTQGTGEKPKKGDLVKINLSIDLDDGTNMRKADEVLAFAAGAGTLIEIIDQSVLSMQAGEKRTLIATDQQVYGASPRSILPKDTLLIFNIELLSINELD